MLKLTLLETEVYDESRNEFVLLPKVKLKLEHSLVSLSKWESIFEKPFDSEVEKTPAENAAYIECMLLTEDPPENWQHWLTTRHQEELATYLSRKHTGTTFPNQVKPTNKTEIITSEVVYYWMVAHRIPFEAQFWNFKRLLTLIEVCNVKNSAPKKQSQRQLAADYAKLNAERKAKYGIVD